KQADRLLLQGINYVHLGKYDDAFTNFKQVQKLLPEHPAGYFFSAAALEWVMIDFRYFEYDPLFHSNIDLTIKFAEKMYDKNEDDPWANFYLGAGYGFSGIYLIKYGNWIKAFWRGIKGYDYMKDAYELDSSIGDVLYATGQYHYYKGLKSGLLSWLPFINKKKEKKMGVKQLRLCSIQGKYCKMEASDSLAKINYFEGNYQKSLELYQEKNKKFPRYVYYKRYIVLSYIGLEKWPQAYTNALELEALIETYPYKNISTDIEIAYYKGLTMIKQGEEEKGLEYLRFILQLPDEKTDPLPHYDEYADKAEELMDELADK
ncbi:MAG TPA: hypothetical protein VKS21_00805, partial [Spirochaetota bacterium]|nr:hypothetical protein [Spirochaetota bacterium]